MKKNKINIPMNTEVFLISSAIKEHLKDFPLENIEIIFYVDENMISKINEEYFFRNNPDAKYSELPEVDDEIIVIADDIKFKYTKKEMET